MRIPFFIVFSFLLNSDYFICQTADIPFLDDEHLPYFLQSNPQYRKACTSDSNCGRKLIENGDKLCWGHEPHCSIERSYHPPKCDHSGDMAEFFRQADFGYIRQRLESVFPLCTADSNSQGTSEVLCSKNLEFCRGKNVMLDFRSLRDRDEILRYKMDVLNDGHFVADCRVDRARLLQEVDFMSPLQSWAPEVQHISSGQLKCDITIDTPTYIMKIDAAVNMYHHFCDFFNLYASQHLNDSLTSSSLSSSTERGFGASSFDRNKQILIWENIPYRSAFAPMFKVFTSRSLMQLDDVAGYRVCFKDLVLPLPPRMIFGLFYNTPLVSGCSDSGLFRAFNRHVLHRLHAPRRHTQKHDTVRVLWLSRRTRYRRVINQQQVIDALSNVASITVEIAEFTHSVPFMKQAAAAASADVLVGVHGAGLTHLLLLPDWAVVYELYDCRDPHCYGSLARLRGLHYISGQHAQSSVTSQNEDPELTAHEKFANYTLDVNEVVRNIRSAVRHVRAHPAFIAARRRHERKQPVPSTGHQEL